MIPQRPFGRTGAAFSELGLGCASYWGLPRFSERAAVALVHQALAGGITVFDTGASYSNGHAEPRLGRALRGRDCSNLLLSSKAGTLFRNGKLSKDFSPAAVQASLENSLRQLGVDCLPLLYLHGCPPELLSDELRDTLAGFKASGKIRWLGLNSFDPQALQHIASDDLFDAVMLDYNLLRPERRPLIAHLHSAGKAVVAGTSLARASYLFSPLRLRRMADLWYLARALATSRADLQRARRWRFLTRQPGWSAAQIALRFVLDNPQICCAMFSTTQAAHLAANLAVPGLQLDTTLAARIEKLLAE